MGNCRGSRRRHTEPVGGSAQASRISRREFCGLKTGNGAVALSGPIPDGAPGLARRAESVGLVAKIPHSAPAFGRRFSADSSWSRFEILFKGLRVGFVP